jgi:hypothetical protein
VKKKKKKSYSFHKAQMKICFIICNYTFYKERVVDRCTKPTRFQTQNCAIKEVRNFFLPLYFYECLRAFVSWLKFMRCLFSIVLRWMWVLHLQTLLFLLPVFVWKLILGFNELERPVWIVFNSYFLLKCWKKSAGHRSYKTTAAISLYVGSLP